MVDPRDRRSSADQRPRDAIRACVGAALLGVVWMAVVLPLVERSPLVALPWTVMWSAIGLLAWRERRHRTVVK